MTASDPHTAKRRLHPLTPVYDLITAARQFWIVLIPLLRPGAGPIDFVVFAIVIAMVAGRIVNWFFTSYSLGETALVFDTGVLQRKNRTVPYDRVQQVDVVQKLRHRLLGVARLDVSTAGGGTGSEIKLDVLSVEEARRLQHLLRSALAVRAGASEATAGDSSSASAIAAPDAVDVPRSGVSAPPSPAETVLLRLRLGELVLAGVTGARLVVVLGAAFTLANAIDDLPIAFWGRFDESDIPAVTTLTVSAAVLAGALLWFGLAALSSIVTDFDFTVRHTGNRFSVSRGLLSRNEVVVPDQRVQTVAFHQSILRRWLDRAAVRVSSAGGHFTIPLVSWPTGMGLLGAFVGAAVLPALQPAPRAALRRAIVRRVVPALVLVAPLLWLTAPAGLVGLVVVPAGAVAGWAAWRGMAHGYDETLLVARRGALYRSFVVVPAAKAQSARVTASWFQRRVDLATLFVDVAGGASARVADITTSRAHELAEALVIPTRARRADDHRSRSDALPRG